MIDRNDHKLSLLRQCNLLGVSRSSMYYRPRRVKPEDLEIMRRIDEQYLKMPCWGSRSMRTYLCRLGYRINRKRVQRLMRLMGLKAIYPKPKTSRPHPEHKIHPYLLRDVTVDRPNQVWATDITYIPMSRGFMYLVAVMDWYSRKVLSWKISNTLDVGFCVEALKEAIERYGAPEIFNTDQGAQFTSKEFIGTLEASNIRISMDGQGRAQDNIFIERLWWTLKHQHVYLYAYENGSQLRTSLKQWFAFYNTKRFHQGLDNRTPDEVYFGIYPVAKAA
jgi:putative transposase